MEKVVILSGTRTPIGKYKGALAEFSPTALGEIAANAAINKAVIQPDSIDQVIIGNVLQAGWGQNIARQIAVNTGIPVEKPAMTVNEVCGSGMKAVILAMQQIQLGEARIVLAGGAESMTQAPLLQKYAAQTDSWEEPISSMINDGLTDAFSQQHMGLTAEKVAEVYHVSREEQDIYALKSQQKAAAARREGKFDSEITPVTLSDGRIFALDEGIRENSSLEKLSTLRTAFAKEGTVTAGNSSTLNDGASMLLLAAKSYADAQGLPYLATIEGYSEIGMDPSIMGVAPIKAIKKLLTKTKISLEEIDLFEINEAFASASVAVLKGLNLPEDKVNIYGGGISLGHPIGASGARIMNTLISELYQEDKQLGVASLCIGGGLGLAVLLKKNNPFDPSSEKKKFYEMTRDQRLENLIQRKVITREEAQTLEEKMALEEDLAEHLVENQIGEIELPLGAAQNFIINGTDYVIPMATEEPSVIAAASNAAKIIAKSGGFQTSTLDRLMRGQIVFQNVAEPEKLQAALERRKADLLVCAIDCYPSIVQRGGGVKEINSRIFEDASDNKPFLSLDVLVDTKDAMGANIINTILEGMTAKLKEWFPHESILFSILSNHTTEALSTATCTIPVQNLTTRIMEGKEVAERIVQATNYAKKDPYRAVTHNKGIMNGVEAVVLATGNDTRAVSAGCHAYAAKDGRYIGLSDWHLEADTLVGHMILPVAVGTVGGATKVFPKAQIALRILHEPNAAVLAEIITAAGLGQNLAALKALVTEGIQKGHMNLQMQSLAISAGAEGAEIEKVAQILQKRETRNLEIAQQVLEEIR